MSVEGGSVVLTLDNFVYSGTGSDRGGKDSSKLYVIYYEGGAPLIIDLKGTSSITHDDDNSSNGYCICVDQDPPLTIRSTDGSGSLTFSHTNKAYAGSYAIRNYGNITLAGGTVIATDSSNEGICAVGGDLILAGATVRASQYTAFSNGTAVKVAEGMTYSDGENLYSGTLSDEQVSALAGKTLTPGYAVNIVNRETAP